MDPAQNNDVIVELLNADLTAFAAETVVNVYLQAMSGPNAGKYFRGSDSSWQTAESIAATATGNRQADARRWKATIVAAAWVANTRYELFARDAGATALLLSQSILCQYSRPTSFVVKGREITIR